MKYSIVYNKTFRYMDTIDEVILYWSTKDDIVDFIKETYKQKQRIVIDFSDKYARELREALPVLERLKKEHSNFAIRINAATQKAFHSLLKEKKINFFFCNFCSNWDSLYAYSLLGVSDVYITEELCFDLKKVKAFCTPRRIKVRVFPNIGQVSGQGTNGVIPEIQKFFIRPEDIPVYEDYIDICELWVNHLDRCSVLYEIYKSEQWLGTLDDIIFDLDLNISTSAFLPNFGVARLGCGKRCQKGDRCSICTTQVELAKMLDEEGISVDYPRQPVKEIDEDIIRKIEEMRNEESESD